MFFEVFFEVFLSCLLICLIFLGGVWCFVGSFMFLEGFVWFCWVFSMF